MNSMVVLYTELDQGNNQNTPLTKQAAYPTPTTPNHHALHNLLGPINQEITSDAVRLIQEGDVPALGRLMCRAQEHFDAIAGPMCPEQLTSPKLHAVLHHPAIQPLIYGGKGVGSQGDGTAQLLCRDAESQQRVCAILQQQVGVHCLELTMHPSAGEVVMDKHAMCPPSSPRKFSVVVRS